MGISVNDVSGIGAVSSLIKDVADKIWPDPAERDAYLQKAQELDNQLTQGQIAIDQAEAANEKLFVSGWRPFIGWTCGVAFAYHYVGEPMIMLGVSCYRGMCVEPSFDMSTLSTVLTGMLGLGFLRTSEKLGIKGSLPWQK